MIVKPQYDTKLFSEVWDNASDFYYELTNTDNPYYYVIREFVDLDVSTYNQTIQGTNLYRLYYLLFARYGNSPIANYDVTQFKMKVASVIFKYGLTWLKKVQIQDTLRNLSEEELTRGSKQISNHAYNPSTEPSTDTLDEILTINDQSSIGSKKSYMEAYGQLWNLLDKDVTSEFIDKFKDCFKQFVMPEHPILYESED